MGAHLYADAGACPYPLVAVDYPWVPVLVYCPVGFGGCFPESVGLRSVFSPSAVDVVVVALNCVRVWNVECWYLTYTSVVSV